MNMTTASQKPIDLDNLNEEEGDLGDELHDAALELRSIGMHLLANSVERARRMLVPADAPKSGTFAQTGVSNGHDVAEFAKWRVEALQGVR